MEPTFTGNFNSINSNPVFDPVSQPDFELLRSFSKTERTYGDFSGNNPTFCQHRDEFLPGDHNQSIVQGRTREMTIPSSGNYPPQHSNLEKLFSHATEVKGDLESVINALVGIIGPDKRESLLIQNDQDAMSAEIPNLSNPNSNFFPHQYVNQSNFNWSNKGTPSVNVENVLKIVRANKINKDKCKMRYDSSQSSESSREKISEKVEYPNSYEYNMQSLLNDPARADRGIQTFNSACNRRKQKSRFHSHNTVTNNWVPTDVCIKRSKSIKSGGEMSGEFLHGPVSNMVAENSQNPKESSDTCNRWLNSVKLSGPLHQEPMFTVHNPELMLPGPEPLDPSYYNQQSNYSWSPNKDLSTGHDESSCSSFSFLSQNQMIYPPSRGIFRRSYDRNKCQKTPSISVSDSEGSTEPTSPISIKRIPRLPSLGTQLRNKEGQYELMLTNQPELHHRARYMTEGSRGAVKDRSGNGFPTIQLIGWKKPATLQIFVGSEEGRVKPHSFYQACKVSGKQIHSCKERMFDGTGLIEIQIETKESQMIVLDCIGILKLRNVDVERRAGIQRVKLKSTMARLVFRVNLPHGDGFYTCLQVTSDPILCTQPVGSPEISKMSLCEGSCKGNMELFIIGKNIVKSCKVLFQDYSEHKGVIWQDEARIDAEYLHQSHLVCTVPVYCNDHLRTPVTVQVVISCNGRVSEPRYFTYLPDNTTKPLDIIEPYDIEDWKMLKSDFTNIPTTFPIDNCPLNSDLVSNNRDEKYMKTTGEIMYDKDSSFPHQMFPSSSTIASNYNVMCPSNKPSDQLSARINMDWMPCTTVNDISISSISTPSSFDTMSNSLDSNIQNDFMLHFSSTDPTNMTNILSESLNTLTESNDTFTHL